MANLYRKNTYFAALLIVCACSWKTEVAIVNKSARESHIQVLEANAALLEPVGKCVQVISKLACLHT